MPIKVFDNSQKKSKMICLLLTSSVRDNAGLAEI